MKHYIIFFALCLASFNAYAQQTPQTAPERQPTVHHNAYVALKGGISKVDVDGDDYDLGTYGIAAGAYINPNMRAEVEAMFYEKIDEQDFFGSYKHETASLSANVFYDFGKDAVKPYFGAGVGMAFLKDKASFDSGYWLYNVNESEVGFLGSLHAGVSAEVHKNVILDAGLRYTYMYKPEGTYFDSYDTSVFSALASLRFAF